MQSPRVFAKWFDGPARRTCGGAAPRPTPSIGSCGRGDLDKPFDLLERLLYDKEFWVQRAVGTWLRECWKEDRRRTAAFLREHVRGLPRVVITVATERAPKSFRDELREAR